MIHLKTPDEIDVIARGGAIIADFLVEVRPRIQPGISTLELDGFADDFIRAHDGAVPAFKGLYGFSGSVCTSLNEEVVHGIPKGDRILEDGDIISIDIGVRLDGWCSDSAWTFPVGDIDERERHLMEVTKDALDRAVSSAIVEGSVGGHRCGRCEDGEGDGPEHHQGSGWARRGARSARSTSGAEFWCFWHGTSASRRHGVGDRGRCLSCGTPDIQTLDDRWTVVTRDGTRSAHFEHTVAVTSAGPRVLTAAPAEAPA